MVMDPSFFDFSDSPNGFVLNDETTVPSFDQHPILANGYKFKDESLDLSFLDVPYLPLEPDPNSFAPSMGPVSDVDSPDEFSDTVFKFLNQILVEENMEAKPSMFHDPLALQATEKSLYEALGEKYPTLPYPPPGYVMPDVQSPDENLLGSSSEYSTNSSTSASSSTDTQWVGDSLEFKSSAVQTHLLDYPSQQSFGSTNSFSNDFNGQVDTFMSSHLVPSIFGDSESILQFKRGMEEASKFLPPSNPIIIDLDKYNLPSDSHDEPQEVVIKVEKDERDNSPNGSRGRKHYHLEDRDNEEERSSKQSAVYVEEVELSDMFDRVLLCTDANGHPVPNCVETPTPKDNSLQQNGQAHRSNRVGKARSRKQGNKTETVDLRALLVSCAQSVAADDCRTANEQLKQIRQHASISGDASQRLAHIFAAGLEARLAGTGSQLYAAQSAKRISAAEKLKAYQVYLSACPFKKISIFFANKMILEAASTARTLHIVDFGIQYGFQWPIIIQRLSERVGGPPKLRITGIELPQPGFRPAERVEETGRRLANYCERFNVPFEYNAIATQNWESIKIEDLKIERDEFLAVNCLFRFKNLLDETVVVDSPRDAVLKLIRRMKPDIFIHAVINGCYSAPFFVTRFREALFHYSSLFDVFDATIDRESEHRLNFEKEFCGREAMNVIACEGAERVERPETYKQWQARNARAGFKLLPLDQELIQILRNKVKSGYHKDFVFDEDGKWILQGWKGRILNASSCWVPA